MIRYVLDARTATPHFPGIGRYMTNLAAALTPLLASDERLTILHHPDHPPALPFSPAVTLVPVDVSPFALAQRRSRACCAALRAGSRNQESGVRIQRLIISRLPSGVRRPASSTTAATTSCRMRPACRPS